MITSAGLSTFTMFDAVKIENLTQIQVAGILIIFSAAAVMIKISSSISKYTRTVLSLQVILVAAMLHFTSKAVLSLQRRNGLPKIAQVGGWTVLILSLTLAPFLHYLKPNNNYQVRLLTIYLTFAPSFVILSISFETMFYFIFTAYLVQWIQIEKQIKIMKEVNSSKNNWLQLLRVAIIGFFLQQIAFFGTGNISSISTFSLDSVYRLLPVFDPFPMGALLMLKLIIPYLLLSCALGIMNIQLDISDYTISSLIISTSDILSLNFFYLLKTEGSWLDIGVTISNYCLAILSSLFMLLLEIVGHQLLKNVSRTTSTEKKQNWIIETNINAF